MILLLDPPTALETRASGPSLNVQVTFLNYAHFHHWYRRRRPALRRPGTEAAVRGTLQVAGRCEQSEQSEQSESTVAARW